MPEISKIKSDAKPNKAELRRAREEEAENASHLWTMLATATNPADGAVLGLHSAGKRRPRGYDDGFARDPVSEDERFSRAWEPPLASRAGRVPGARSKEAIRGRMHNDANGREMHLDSALEWDFLCVLRTHRHIVDIQEQAGPVTYVDEAGKFHEHTFDALVITDDGTRVAIAVKPEDKRQSSGVDKVVGYFREQNDGSFADRFVVRSRHHFTRDQVHDARLILRARREQDGADCDRLRTILLKIPGTFRLSDVLESSGIELGKAFIAAVNLFDEGLLELACAGRFLHDATVRVANLGQIEAKP
jgi:hypothetical protein